MTSKQTRFLELLTGYCKTQNNKFSAKDLAKAFDLPVRQVYYYLEVLLNLNKIVCYDNKYGAQKYSCVLPKYSLTDEDISILLKHKKNQKATVLETLRSEIQSIDTEISALKLFAALR
jgi:hypothetical protein